MTKKKLKREYLPEKGDIVVMTNDDKTSVADFDRFHDTILTYRYGVLKTDSPYIKHYLVK